MDHLLDMVCIPPPLPEPTFYSNLLVSIGWREAPHPVETTFFQMFNCGQGADRAPPPSLVVWMVLWVISVFLIMATTIYKVSRVYEEEEEEEEELSEEEKDARKWYLSLLDEVNAKIASGEWEEDEDQKGPTPT